jgi:hypothetical protein
MTTFSYIIAAVAIGCVVGYGVGRYRDLSFQNLGEALVSRKIQTYFKSPDFHLFNHVTLRVNDGTTQIDHILVSRYGVFVIETKDYSGWIFANAKQSTWTQVLYRYKFKFQNPIKQNARHMYAVRELLDFLPANTLKPIVVFAGTAKFKTEMPEGVYNISGFIDFVQKHTEEVISLNRVQFCVGRLETARLAVSRQTDLEHLQSLQRRHGKRT